MLTIKVICVDRNPTLPKPLRQEEQRDRLETESEIRLPVTNGEMTSTREDASV
jgi:hypothetical protein